MKLIATILLSQIWSLTPEPLPVLDWSLDSQPREEVIQSNLVSVDAPAAENRSIQPPKRIGSEKPLLQIWSQSTGCPPCNRLKADINAGRLFGFRLQWMAGNPPERRGFPTICFAGEYTTGWPVSDVERIAKIRQLKEAAGIESGPVQAVATVQEFRRVQPVRMQWNIEGDWSPSESQTRAHLESDHGINTAGMTHQQMLQAHDAAHNGRQYAVRQRPVQVQSCPGLGCPPQRRMRFGGLFR